MPIDDDLDFTTWCQEHLDATLEDSCTGMFEQRVRELYAKMMRLQWQKRRLIQIIHEANHCQAKHQPIEIDCLTDDENDEEDD